MTRWFRMYADALRNPKVASLSDRDYRTWVGLLSVAAENDGSIPPLDTLRRLLMMRLDHLSSALKRLASIGLIDALASGYEPHNWNKFQYKSDTSAPRVTLHRQRKSAQVVTPPETDTETDISDTNVSSVRGSFPRPEFADPEHWRDLLANRKAKRLRNTPTAYKSLLADIERLADAEWPPGRLIAHAAAKGWGGIYDPREGERNGTNHNGHARGGGETGRGRTIDAAFGFLEDQRRLRS